jgi:hypothetical protein
MDRTALVMLKITSNAKLEQEIFYLGSREN